MAMVVTTYMTVAIKHEDQTGYRSTQWGRRGVVGAAAREYKPDVTDECTLAPRRPRPLFFPTALIDNLFDPRRRRHAKKDEDCALIDLRAIGKRACYEQLIHCARVDRCAPLASDREGIGLCTSVRWKT
jgi:hypothetical protein